MPAPLAHLLLLLALAAALEPRAQALLERAEQALKANDRAAALQSYVDAVKIDPRAATLDTIQRYAPPVYSVEANPPDTEAARAAMVVALRQYLELHPHDLAAARLLIDADRPDETEPILTALLRTDPNEAELYAIRGTVRARAARHNDAIADFARAAELDPKNAERQYVLGVTLYETATKGPAATDAQKKELIRRGIAALERAEALRAGYFEAMLYRSLLLRATASLETDPTRQAELNRRAEKLRDAARAAAAQRAASPK